MNGGLAVRLPHGRAGLCRDRQLTAGARKCGDLLKAR